MGLKKKEQHKNMSEKAIFVRVKRPMQTVFLQTDAAETVSTAKNKLAAMCEFPAEKIRLAFNGSLLDEEKTMADYKIENDNILYQIQATDEGEWETIEEIEESVRAKN